MRLLTCYSDGGTKLFAEASRGVVDLGASGERELVGVRDVGDLLRRGTAAMASARRAIAEANGTGKGLSQIDESLPLAPPVVAPRAIHCIGRNFAEHAAEGGEPVPVKPILFAKYPNTLIGNRQQVIHHRITTKLDYEGELCVVIGQRARHINAREAASVIGGYTIINDISARDLQLGDLQWIRGKSLDTFAPVGPVVVTPEEILDPYALRIVTRVNGVVRQNESCSAMVFSIERLIEFITEAITLEPGDLIATGTPAGVGHGMDPPKYLKPGDEVAVSIDPIGTLHSSVTAEVLRNGR